MSSTSVFAFIYKVSDRTTIGGQARERVNGRGSVWAYDGRDDLVGLHSRVKSVDDPERNRNKESDDDRKRNDSVDRRRSVELLSKCSPSDRLCSYDEIVSQWNCQAKECGEKNAY